MNTFYDMHTHVFPPLISEKASKSIGRFYCTENVYEDASVATLEAAERKAGAEKALICSAAVCASQVTDINNFISGCCMKSDCFIGFGTLHPDFQFTDSELDRIVSLGLRGLKFHPEFQHFAINDMRMYDIYKKADKLGLIILFHVGDDRSDLSSPERLASVVHDFPDLKIIAAHFGGYRCWDRCESLPLSDNLFFDTSSSLMYIEPSIARKLISHFGASHFLFGSDFPMWDPQTELDRLLSLSLGDSVNAAILSGNASSLIN